MKCSLGKARLTRETLVKVCKNYQEINLSYTKTRKNSYNKPNSYSASLKKLYKAGLTVPYPACLRCTIKEEVLNGTKIPDGVTLFKGPEDEKTANNNH